MAFIRITCKNDRCKTLLSVPTRLAGEQVKCSCCGQMVRVPDRPSLRQRPARRAA